ncbi:MAG TPA: adenylate/guanylate cyclase domain-containing protein [Burkholderiales bacterium]|nr:adenylate/guanylate cyclase domain-containing protein [Burkholderiales bacterium]
MALQAIDVQPIIDWLEGSRDATPEAVISGLNQRMVTHGISLARVAVFVRTLHPNAAGRAFFWRAEKPDEVEVDVAEHEWMLTPAHLQSPIYAIMATGREIRRRLADAACPMDFPVLAELREEGLTDYYAAPLPSLTGEKLLCTFATRRAGGFTDAEMAGLRRLLAPVGRVAEILAWRRKAQNILEAYLGKSAGDKVLSGLIRRGDGEDIHAVIWFCDLRDSTPLADSMSRSDFLKTLNDFFECVLAPVIERDGEVLRFIGDAALAIFPVGADTSEACRRALDAAQAAISRLNKLNKTRATPLRFGIGLHLGDVLYGNIGTASRLEFTVIGAAANEAARIEALCKTLDVPFVLSERVAAHIPGCRSLGRHSLRGVSEPVEVFTL